MGKRKTEEQTYIKCIDSRESCAACENGLCLALNESARKLFRNGVCPFYKVERDQAKAQVDTRNRLLAIGREDLLHKYRGAV